MFPPQIPALFLQNWCCHYYSKNIIFLYYKPNVEARIHLTELGKMVLDSSGIELLVKLRVEDIAGDG